MNKIMKFVVIGQIAFSAIGLLVLLVRSPAPPAAQPLAPGAHAKKDEEGAKKGKGKRKKKKEPAAADGHAAAGGEGHGAASGEGHGAAHDEGADEESEDEATFVDVPPLNGDPKSIARGLLAGNTRFVDGERGSFDLTAQREHAAKGQHPAAMILGCADSRVSPEYVFDRGIGELFVVRSAGNIAEPVAVGSLEYAAEHLHSKVLLILGHEKCGAVQAALGDEKMPTPNLEAVVGHILPGIKGLKAWAEDDHLLHLAVEANVQRQAQELLRQSPVLRGLVTKGEIAFLKAVYDISTGHVRPLP